MVVAVALAALAVSGAVLSRLSSSADRALPSPVHVTQPSLPADATECPATFDDTRLARSARGTSSTSCEFAESVRKAYLSDGTPGEPATVSARSPVTGQDYTMRCTGRAPVRCTGGDNALVLLY